MTPTRPKRLLQQKNQPIGKEHQSGIKAPPALITPTRSYSGVAQSDFRWHPLPAFGCYIALGLEGFLLHAPMLKDGTMEPDNDGCNWGEVSAPESQKFLNACNRTLGTSYKVADFPSR